MHRVLTSKYYKVGSPNVILDSWTQDQLNQAHDTIDWLEKIAEATAPKPRTPRRK